MPDSTQPNPSDNHAAQVIERLKGDILTGYFFSGEKLAMARLKERYQVGVGPLREALSRLIVEQLVVVENQRGFRVHPVSMEEMEDVYETRAHIEALCVRLAVEKGGDDWEAGIVAAAHRLKKSGTLMGDDIKDTQEWEFRHQQFHLAVAEGCGSDSLLQVRRSLYEKASRYRNLWLQHNMVNSSVFDANQREHEELVEALLDRDQARACELIYQHLLGPKRELLKTLPSLIAQGV
ncbi:MAG: DNA-binding transcriptional regulator CsiR [Endozoicomonas sp.]